VENAGGKAYGKATGLYNKHRKYSEQLNPWHPFQSPYDFQQVQLFSQQMKIWIDQPLWRGLDNFKIDSFQSAHAMRKLLSEFDFGLSNDSWIDDDSHIFGTLYYRDIFKYIKFLLAHLPFQAYLNFEPVHLADSEGNRIYSEMNMGVWWWETQDQLPAGVAIVPVICTSDKTHLTNISDDQYAWLLYLTIENIRNSIRRPPKQRAWILASMIPCPPKGAPIRHSTFRPLNTTREQHITSELLEDNNIDALHTLGIHPIRNQFWQFPLCNVYRLWQPDELHQLLLGLVQDLLHWLLR